MRSGHPATRHDAREDIISPRKTKSKAATSGDPSNDLTADGQGAALLARWLDNSDLSLGLRLAIMMNLIVRPYRKYKALYKMPLMDWRVMMCIAAAPGATAQEIASFGGFDKMTISAALKRLIAQGRVARESDPADRRRLQLELTSKGRTIYRSLSAEVHLMEEELLARFTPQEQIELRAMIDRLLSVLRTL
jgi:DNA-binding MarR family transcriptional regulator